MDEFDLAQYLEDNGVDHNRAVQAKASIRGSDLMQVIDAVTSGKIESVNHILGKYGIRMRSNNPMDESFLKARYESLASGQALDETFGVMTRISEGFSYAVQVSEQTRDLVLDWLDENQVEYQAVSPLSYNIACEDREAAYRTGRALSGILGKATVRDSVEIEEKMDKKSKQRIKDAGAKMADMKPRNPVATAASLRGGAGAHTAKDARKADKYGRDAKHKPRFDEEIEFAIGDDVMVGEVAGTVKIPHGPNGTVGVIMNGHLEMVSENEVSRLDEGVIGMSKVNPLFRLRELAGLSRMSEDDFDGIEVADAPEIDPAGVLAPGPVSAEPEDLDIDGVGADPVADPMDDMDGGMDASAELGGDIDAELGGDIDADAGIPGAIGSDPVEMPGASPEFSGALGGVGPGLAPQQSPAMSQIEDSLNSIQTGLAEIRLSEYKSLIQKLQDLTNQVQMMGRDYLGERRKK